MPGLALAIIAEDGTVVHASGPWTETGLRDAAGNGGRSFDLAPRTDRVGRLIATADTPAQLFDTMSHSVSLVLREVLEKHDLARETLERYREINLLYRASETIGAALDPGEVPRLVLLEAERVIPADLAAVLIGDERPPQELALAGDLIAEVRGTGRPDIAAWAVNGNGGERLDLHSVLCVPVRAGDRVLGTVVLGRRSGRPAFTASDEKLLLGLASHAGVALERAWLHEHETQHVQLEQELSVARRIQLSLLPAAPPSVTGWDFAAAYRAAHQVGGDFYDFLDHALSGRRLGLVIADVTGKGMPAALVMAYSRAVVRAESLAGSSPVEVLGNTNRLLLQERRSRPFVSAFYGELDLASGLLSYANAGHDRPLLVPAEGEPRELVAPGVILGAFHDVGLEPRSVSLAPGDTVVLYTDGVTEARDPQGQFFGDDRLRDAVVGAGRAPAQGVIGAVLASIAEFTAGAEQSDDLTMVVVRRE